MAIEPERSECNLPIANLGEGTKNVTEEKIAASAAEAGDAANAGASL